MLHILIFMVELEINLSLQTFQTLKDLHFSRKAKILLD